MNQHFRNFQVVDMQIFQTVSILPYKAQININIFRL